jgi:hypothetical protein
VIATRERVADRIQAILASPDPEMRTVDRYPILKRRVRVMLDGEDATRLCRGFSIPTGRVELLVKEGGKYLLDFTCGCTTIRGRRPPYQHCPECHQEVIVTVATETRHGKVEVIPL